MFSVARHSNICKWSQQRFGIISSWAYQWKINFNPDPTTQNQKVIFVSQSSPQKQLGVTCDNKLIFEENLKMVSSKINKTLWLLPKLLKLLPRYKLISLDKAFVTLPNLNMVILFMIKRIICPSTKNWNLFSITGAIHGTSHKNFTKK